MNAKDQDISWAVLMPLLESEIAAAPVRETIEKVMSIWGNDEQRESWNDAREIDGTYYPTGYLMEYVAKKRAAMCKSICMSIRDIVATGDPRRIESIPHLMVYLDDHQGKPRRYGGGCFPLKVEAEETEDPEPGETKGTFLDGDIADVLDELSADVV